MRHAPTILIEACREQSIQKMGVPPLIKAESDLHADLNTYRPSIFHGGLELPLLDGIDRFCVQPETKSADYAYIARASLVIDNEPQDACSLSLGNSGLVGVLRIRRGKRLRSEKAATDFEYATADRKITRLNS